MSKPKPMGGTLYLISIQVASRGLTFIGNQVLLRYLSPTLLGIAVQLELVSVTILYFARESLRVALQRQPVVAGESKDTGKGKQAVQTQSQATVNISYLAVASGLAIALLSGLWYHRVAEDEVVHSPQFIQAFYIYGAATLIELCAEPFFVVVQQHSLYKERARAETSGAIARCLCACATAFMASRRGLPPSVFPFAVGQLAYSVILFVLYLHAASRPSQEQHFQLLPQTIRSPPSTYILSLFHKPILSLATTMYIQSIFKLFLTEGDHLILSLLSSLADQGAFALASNYGGLLARLVFQPVEESSRNTFGRLLSSPPPPSTTTDNATKDETDHQTQPSNANITLALTHLSTTLRCYTLFSLPLLCLAPPLIPSLAPIILSSSWAASTTALLSTYVYYIPFLAVNGILDSFVTSVATPSQLRLQSLFMAVFTAVYGGVCYLLLKRWGWGSEGLVWANVVNMGCRIAWGVVFVDSWIQLNASTSMRDAGKSGVRRAEAKQLSEKFWRETVPSVRTVGVTAVVGAWLKYSVASREGEGVRDRSKLLGLDLKEVGQVVAGGVLVGSTVVLFEGEFLLSLLEAAVPERLASKIPFLGSKSRFQRNTPTSNDEQEKEL